MASTRRPPAPPPTEQWAALNEVQQDLLLAVYHLDQAAEEYQRTAWDDRRTRRPATEWRWQTYGYVNAGPGVPRLGGVRAALNATTRRSPRVPAALLELAELRLLDYRADDVTERQRSESWCRPDTRLVAVRMTRQGRAVARISGVEDRTARRAPRGMLSNWLWEVLVELWQAGADGVPADTRWTAWSYLTDRKDGPLIQKVQVTAEAAKRFRRSHTGGPGWALNDLGRAHYEQHWATYATLYPGVAAPDPAGQMTWPAAVDGHLRALAGAVNELRHQLDRVIEQREQLQPAPPVPRFGSQYRPPAIQPADAAVPSTEAEQGRALRAAADALDAEYRQQRAALLAEHEPVLRTLYRTAAARYAAAATAATQACLAGVDPTSITFTAEPLELDRQGRPTTLPALTTGLPGVDADLTAARAAALTTPAAARRGRRRDALPPEREPAAMALYLYARQLAELVRRGELQRLRLRAADKDGVAVSEP